MAREDKATAIAGEGPVTEDMVADYLAAHPDFLRDRPDVLAHMVKAQEVRPRPDGVIDLQCFMVDRLRNEVGRLKQGQKEIVSTARANETSLQRLQTAILFLLDAGSFEELIQIIANDLAVLLDLDIAALLVESDDGDLAMAAMPASVRLVDRGFVDHVTGGEEVVLQANADGDEAIYGGGAGLVASQALVRLTVSKDSPPCLLALGSREPDMFHPGMRTDLIGFLGKVIERVIHSWLTAGR
ncbi:MAG: DUF484 family protein [Pseudomonadota bacterium]